MSEISNITSRAFSGDYNCQGGISIWILYEFYVFSAGYFKANPPSIEDCYNGSGWFYHNGYYSVNSGDINPRV